MSNGSRLSWPKRKGRKRAMTDLLALYDLAEDHGVDVYWFDLGTAESLSLSMSDGSCAIAMDPWRMPTLADEKCKLGHELGHCETGAFYNRYATRDLRQKHELRANRWAYKKLIPKDELLDALRQGYREPWELAEYFDVTEPFLWGALEYYQAAAEGYGVQVGHPFEEE